jgi:hypothetical protein
MVARPVLRLFRGPTMGTPSVRLAAAIFGWFAVLMSPPAQAAETRIPQAEAVIPIVVVSDSFESADSRSKLASAVLAWCRAVVSALPTNTPAEAAWVEREGNTTDLDRIRRLDASPEFGRYRLGEAFTDCVARAEKVKLAQDRRNLRAEGHISLALRWP